MLLKRPVKVDIITEQKRDWLPLIISLFAVLVSVGTFLFNYLDVQQQRKQERDDFYSKEATYLKINFDEMTTGVVQIKDAYHKRDTAYRGAVFNIINSGSQRCEILSIFSINYNDVSDPPLLYSIPNSIKEYSNYSFYFSTPQEILPNDSIRTTIGLPKLDNINNNFTLIIIYRNTVGGIYAIQYDLNIGSIFVNNVEIHSQKVLQKRKYFRVFTKEQFQPLMKKISYIYEYMLSK